MLIEDTITDSDRTQPEPFRILIVDDDSQICELLSAILENADHQIETRSRGKSAIHAIQTQRFDLVVTDISMPGVLGDRVLAAAKQANPQIPVVVITAHPAEITNRRIFELGADDILLKPFDVTDFTSIVERHLTFRH